MLLRPTYLYARPSPPEASLGLLSYFLFCLKIKKILCESKEGNEPFLHTLRIENIDNLLSIANIFTIIVLFLKFKYNKLLKFFLFSKNVSEKREFGELTR